MFYEKYLWFYISYVIIYILQRDYKHQTFLGMSILSALSLVAVDTAALCFIHMPISNNMLNSLMVYWIIWLDCGFLHNSESKKNYDSILILQLFYSV